MKIKVYVLDFEIPPAVKRRALRVGIPGMLLLGAIATAYAAVPKRWTTEEVLTADDLNSSFDTVVLLDGSRPMTGQLSLSGDPTAVGHASRKAYVDALARARLAAGGGDVAAHIGSSIDPGATQMIWRAATVVIPWSNTSPNRVTFPAPFPNGFLSVVVSHSSGGNFPLELAAHPVSLGAFDVFLDPLPPTGQLYRIDYIAIGW